MTAVAEAPHKSTERKEPRARNTREGSPTNTEKTLAHWDKFLAKQPGCDTGFAAAPGQAMRAINVSSAAQVPMILRELHRGDGTIRINFPSSGDPKVTEDQVKIRAFLQGHHGEDLASLKGELVKLLEDSHSFQKLEENPKFTRSFASAEQWINANLSGVESDSSSLDVTDVVSVKGTVEGTAEEREPHVTGVIASLHKAVTAGRGAVITISQEDARDDGLRGVIKTKLGENSTIDPSKIAVWVGADVSSTTKERPDCQGVIRISLAEFLNSTEISPRNETPTENNDLVLGGSSATTRPPEATVEPEPSNSLVDLKIGSVAPQQVAAPTQSTELKCGVAVDNHRTTEKNGERKLAPQEDRHLARSFPAIAPEQAIEYLRHSATAMDEVTNYNNAGSTFTGVIVTEDGNLVTSHLGDSPASAVIIDKNGNLKEVITLIQDHKPVVGNGTSPTGIQYDDVENSRNGVVYRVINYDDPENRAGVAMTRALGNAHFRDVLSHEPELRVHDIQKRLQEGDRLFLLVTSDGAHNEAIGVTHSKHGATIAEELRQGSSLADISTMIASNSAEIYDNVTVALLEVEAGKGALVAVFDGHGGSDTSDQAQSVLHEITDRFAQKTETPTIEQIAKQVTLEKRSEALKKRLDDAYELRGDFSKGAELVAKEVAAQKKVAAAEKMRELQGQLSSALTEERTDDIARLQQEIDKIYEDHNMIIYGQSGSSFDENVGLFESDWKNDLSRIGERITRYDKQVLTPAMEKMKLELSELQEKIAAARVSAFENQPSETEVVNIDTVTPEPDSSSQTTLDEQQRERLEARLRNLSTLLEHANRLDGPWTERLAPFQQPIEEARKAIAAADKVVELERKLQQEQSGEVGDRRNSPDQKALSRIYSSHKMYQYRGHREERCSPQDAVQRFKSHWEGQLQAAQASREEYIQEQVRPYQTILTALISQTKRDLGQADDTSLDASSQITPEKIEELIGMLRNDELKAELARYRDTLLNEGDQAA